jgi:hypothetical protein
MKRKKNNQEMYHRYLYLHINHRQILAFLDIKNNGADLFAMGLGSTKIFLKINSMSRIHALKQLCSGRVRLGLT